MNRAPHTVIQMVRDQAGRTGALLITRSGAHLISAAAAHGAAAAAYRIQTPVAVTTVTTTAIMTHAPPTPPPTQCTHLISAAAAHGATAAANSSSAYLASVRGGPRMGCVRWGSVGRQKAAVLRPPKDSCRQSPSWGGIKGECACFGRCKL